MSKKFIVLSAMTLLLMLALAGPAAALEGNCGTIDFTLTPDQGPAGTSVAVNGSGAMLDFPFGIYWESTSGDLLASGTSTASGDFSADITIPAGASMGAHDVVFFGTQETEDPAVCARAFTVIAATGAGGVQPDAYTEAARTSMPSTGIFLLPAAGLLAAGAGLLLARRRS